MSTCITYVNNSSYKNTQSHYLHIHVYASKTKGNQIFYNKGYRDGETLKKHRNKKGCHPVSELFSTVMIIFICPYIWNWFLQRNLFND